MIRASFIWLFVCIVLHNANAQSFYFRHYEVENGLSNNTVFCCVQDQQGFIWMGTKDGLNRFDGYNYKVFRNNAADSLSIGDNFIRSLFVDGTGQLYAGTRNGLYRYNAIRGNFTTLYRCSNEIRDILKDQQGNIWMVAGQTLIRLQEADQQVKIFQTSAFFAATSICLLDGVLWVSTSNGQLQRYNERNGTFIPFDVFPPEQHSSRWIEKIYSADGSTILVGTSNYGIKMFNASNGIAADLLTYNADKTEIFARAFVQTSPDEFWIATESGVFVYNMVTKHVVNLKKQYNNPYSISDNAVYALCRDKEGGIWAGTYFGGVNYYPRQYTSFEKYFPDYNRGSISGNAVREICEDKHGDLWVGTEDAGLNRLDRKTGLFTQFTPTGSANGIAYPNIHGLLTRGNELWVGTFEHGLDVLDIVSGKVVRHYPGKGSKLRSSFIVIILQTRTGEIFIGTREGVYRFDETSHEFEDVEAIPGTSFIHTMLQDSEGLVWVGTMGDGLYQYNTATGKATHYLHQAGQDNAISSNSITTIFQDSKGNHWIGTEGGGLCKMNADGSFVNYAAKDGLPGNTIFKMLEDGHHQLWITTSKGLVCFDPVMIRTTVYTTANGLLSDQFNYNSGYKDSKGTMYFGCVKGMISFNPDAFFTNTYTPPLIITSLQSNNTELPLPAAGDGLPVELTYDQGTFSIDFAALSFTAPEMTGYQYIMEGLDDTWTYLKTNRKVYFTNLAPGTYRFKVKAANSSGIWNPVATEMSIHILPPVWKSTWALVLYAVALLLLLYYVFRKYHERQNEKTRRQIELLEHEKEKEIYDAKIKFFTDIAHEIKTPLTLIKAPMETVMMKAGNSAAIGTNLRIMQRNTDRLIELTNQLLDFRRVETKGLRLNYETIQLDELLAERYSSFKPIADQKNVGFELRLPPAGVGLHADLDALQKILNNLFANALNYCQQFVEVTLLPVLPNDTVCRVEFSNDGYTIPADKRSKIFEPFVRLSGTQNKNGSGIGLALSRSLAELHKGSISYREGVKGLNVFVLELPLGQRNNLLKPGKD